MATVQVLKTDDIKLNDHDRLLREAVLNPYAVLAELCKRKFSTFMKEFWECVSQEKLIWNWHIDYLTAQLQSMAERVAAGLPRLYDIIINIPPGTTKSLTASVMFPAYCWARWPWMQFICASYGQVLSLDLGEKCRDLIRSEKYRMTFPYIGIKEDKDTKSYFRIIKYVKKGNGINKIISGSRFSTSVGKTTLTGLHYHIGIIDDPLDPTRAVSDVERKSANYWYDNTWSTRKVNKVVSASALIMQRLHQDDQTGHALNNNGDKIFHICLPGEIVNFKRFVRPVELINMYQDNLLDPVRLPWSVLKEYESRGQYFYAGQVGQNPTPPGGGMFKVDHLQIIESILNSDYDIIEIVRAWDNAATEDGGAYSCGVKMCSLRGGKYVVMDVVRGQWSTDEREQIKRETADGDRRQHKKRVTQILEQEPGSAGKDQVRATVRNLAGHSVIVISPRGDKAYRADPFSVQVNNGNVYLLKGEWNKAYKDELRFFPFSTYKDQVDPSGLAFDRLASKKIVKNLRTR